jgi:photolyase PhrII
MPSADPRLISAAAADCKWVSDLQPSLAERIVVLSPGEPRPRGEFVLYWAHHALRAHDNPALETAAALANRWKLPLLVYQGLGGRHRYNSDRHHRFILESARDFAKALESVGLRLHFHLPEDPVAPGPLRALVARSAATVSELYPVPPFPAWYERHTAAHPDGPWLLVDASCILPMPLSNKRPTRAYLFRKAYESEQRERASAVWPAPEAWPAAFEGDAGFEPFDLAGSLDQAIARCRIDHSLPPVAGTPGGTDAGYRRWTDFLADGLGKYHRLRNDATLPHGVSRMSPYLHYGCVSPFRIAREALEQGGSGAEKFLDELLTWRELSHHFCHLSDSLESLDAIPDWAVRTLQEHRPAEPGRTYDWETLLRGRTGEPLWDLAQRSLLRRGELHNNVRMSWGKAFLPWAPRPERALKLMIDLNHRLALDGNDPNSYGGLLWCLGQFDRPFPSAPVFGSVRRRSLAKHADRLDMGRYAHQVSVPAGGKRLRVAVIGAGLAGLTAARILQDQGHDVVVVEKARGAGGRSATRRHDEWRFDHGAQYFTARDPRFLRHVLAWQERGLAALWEGRIGVVENGRVQAAGQATQRFVGVPGMNAVSRELAAELSDCRFQWRVEGAAFEQDAWRLQEQGGGTLEAEALVITTPPEQIGALLGQSALRDAVEQALEPVAMRPCWALMAVLDRPLLEQWDAAFVNEGALAWVCGQASKPGRPRGAAWVLHATPEWSEAHLELEAGEAAERLLEAARELPGVEGFQVEHSAAHRWRYALAREPLDQQALWFGKQRLALAGDWCAGSRVEGAFLSGTAAAGRIMGSRFARG